MNKSIRESQREYCSKATSQKNRKARQTATKDFFEYLLEHESEYFFDIDTTEDIHDGYVNRYINQRQDDDYSDATIYSRVWLLISWLNIDDSKINWAKLKGPNRRRLDEFGFLDHQEFSQLINSEIHGKRHQKRNEFAIKWGYYIGSRATETAEIKLKDVHPEERYVKIETLKGGNDRKVYFSRYFARQIEDYIENVRSGYKYADKSPYLLVSEQSANALSQTRLNTIVRETAKNAGIQHYYEDAKENKRHSVVWTTLRDSFASNRLRAGQDLYSLSLAMGHTTTEMTETYLTVLDEDRKQQAEKYSQGAPKSIEETAVDAY
ncbi:tyrosine-type recombinase/integrase [Halorubrum distributum]|uniref:tyrosine-type recombinase/integrase n=1 Tax=Halorubrum distributum TaxID=29283 RepID=UPI0009B5C83D|nr:site-specific integrase [Halorubrum arcis]